MNRDKILYKSFSHKSFVKKHANDMQLRKRKKIKKLSFLPYSHMRMYMIWLVNNTFLSKGKIDSKWANSFQKSHLVFRIQFKFISQSAKFYMPMKQHSNIIFRSTTSHPRIFTEKQLYIIPAMHQPGRFLFDWSSALCIKLNIA